MTEAIAAAPATFGQSIAVAIPQCVQIAVDYGAQIAGKLAALLASGENLIKLIDGALGVLKIVKQVHDVHRRAEPGWRPARPRASEEAAAESGPVQLTVRLEFPLLWYPSVARIM